LLEYLPQWLGEALKGLRAGGDKLAICKRELNPAGSLRLTSPAFAEGGALPARFTADGEGLSPPLVWASLPEGTASLVLIVEDPDAPARQPLVHALLWDIAPELRGLEEGAIGGRAPGSAGRNSYLGTGWLPPDPPTGHGDHHYAFQLFALSEKPVIEGTPGRSALIAAMRGRVRASGLLTGTYCRGGKAAAPLPEETPAAA
jgi:Raf kinase inhibitor-like YbhB/YbcL family protein